VITGYKFHNNEVKEFARGDPQKPQVRLLHEIQIVFVKLPT
jgi:hypothetical protein